MKRNFILFIISLLIFCNCKNEKKEISNYNEIEVIQILPETADEYINLSNFADSIEIIQLNKDSKELIGVVHRIIIRDKYIYLIDKTLKQIILFDKEGNFVTKLSKYGDGPECYSFLGPVFIDSLESYIDIIDMRANKILRYSNPTFELIKSNSFPDINFNSCVRAQDSIYYIATQQHENIINGKNTNTEFVIYTTDGFINNFFDKKIDTERNNYSAATESILESCDDESFYYSSMFTNTIYSIDSISLKPLYYIDFGNCRMPEDLGTQDINEQINYIHQMKETAAFPIMTLNNKQYTFITYFYKEKSNQSMFRTQDLRQFIIDKNNNRQYHTKKIINDICDFPKYISFDTYFGCVHDIYYNKDFVEVIIPSIYLESIGEESVIIDGIGEITSEDDPIVVLMKPKKRL